MVPAEQAARSGRVERASLVIANASLWGMLGITFAEVVARTFHFSLGLSDEVGGYLLATLTFFSLPACHAEKVFHQVEFLLSRLSARKRLVLELVFDVLCVACTAVLLWQCGRLAMNSLRSGELSQNGLDIPLWIPQTAVAVGLLGLAWAVTRTFVNGVRLMRTCKVVA